MRSSSGLRGFLFLLSLTAAALFPAVPASAQIFEQVGVRAQGMGGAFVAVADDATATWWNPAGLAAGPYFNALFEYDRSEHPSEFSASGFALAVPSLGVSYYRLPVSHIRPVSPTAQGGGNRQDQGILNQFGATVGQSMGRYLVVASTLKLTSAAGDIHGGLDIGAMASYNGLRAGLTVKNVTAPSFGSGDSRFSMVRQVRAGVALVGHPHGLFDQVTGAFDGDLTTTPTPAGDERHASGGVEIWMWQHHLGLRGGASANTIGATRASASAGLSLAVRKGTYLDGMYTGGSDPVRKGWAADFRVTY